jgi:cell division protease FtsH
MAKNLLLWLVIAAVLLSIFNNFSMQSPTERMVYSEFIQEIQRDQVRKVTIDGLTIYGERLDGSRFETTRPMLEDPQLIDDLLSHSVEVEGREPEQQSVWTQLLVASFPILIIIAVFMFFMRQMQGGAGGRGGPMSFGKSKARLLGEDQITTTFADVAGVDEAKEDVQELVEFLRDPSKFQKLGGRIPRGVLMVGQPGTGKTLLAKAIAGEAKVPFFSISGSDFVEMFVGVGASRVRDMFDQAKKQRRASSSSTRSMPWAGIAARALAAATTSASRPSTSSWSRWTASRANDGVIVIAATNRPDVLDPALLRPGRFDRQVVVGLPDIRGREQILKVHMRKVPLSEDVDASKIARGTPGFLRCRPRQPGQRGGAVCGPGQARWSA